MSDESPEVEADKLQLYTLLRRFNDAGVAFIVIGGRAEQMMGGDRLTNDSDFCYQRDRENLHRLAGALTDLHPRPRDMPPGVPLIFDARTLEFGTSFTLETDVGKVDLLGEVEPIGAYDDVLKNAETFQVEGRVVRTISLEDLIRVKEHICRAKDLASLDQLYMIRDERLKKGEE